MIRFSESDGALTFSVRVVPRASRSSVAGEHEGALRVRIAAPPIDGAANDELIRLLASILHLPARDVEIRRGQTAKLKQIRVRGVTGEQLEALLK